MKVNFEGKKNITSLRENSVLRTVQEWTMLKHLYYQIYTLSFVKWLLTGHQKQKKNFTL